jgi:hypothetical protein
MEAPPPAIQMIQMLAGFQVSQALYVAAKLGVADELVAGPVPVEHLASRLDADPAALGRLLRTLSSIGVFTQVESDVFGSTPLGDTLATSTPGSMRDLALMWTETHYLPFSELLHTVRTGVPAATHYYGRPFFDWLADDPAQVKRFTGAMGNLTAGVKAGAVASFDFSDIRRVVDIGGADGALVAQILAGHPEASAVVFDLPHVVDGAATTAKSLPVSDRIELVGGDFFVDVPAGGDTYLLSMILHDWDDEHAARILANIRTAAPDARVLAFELVAPAGDEPHMAKMIDLTMLGMLTGRERDERELHRLFQSAGYEIERFAPTPTPMTVVVARPR